MLMGDADIEHPIPVWLRDARADGPLPLTAILDGSVYYPACGLDGVVFSRVRTDGAPCVSFVHADYAITWDKLDRELQRPVARGGQGLLGYRIAFRRAISRQELEVPGYRTPEILTPDERYSALDKYAFVGVSGRADGYCEWVVFDRLPEFAAGHGPARLSLLYMRADGVAAYHGAFVARGLAPLVLVIKQPGHGFGGNYTDFFREGAPLHRVVSAAGPQPEWIAFGGYSGPEFYREQIWSGYAIVSEERIGADRSLVFARALPSRRRPR
jgi:hypothetical protein